jgi:hypothetical protein
VQGAQAAAASAERLCGGRVHAAVVGPIFLHSAKVFAKHLFFDVTGTVSKIVFDRSLKMYGKPCRYGVAYGNHKSTVFRISWDCRRVMSIAEGGQLANEQSRDYRLRFTETLLANRLKQG